MRTIFYIVASIALIVWMAPAILAALAALIWIAAG